MRASEPGALTGLTAGERRRVQRGDSIPNAPLRAAVLAWVEREQRRRLDDVGAWGGVDDAWPLVTLNELFSIAGFENSQARRFLGLAGEGRRRRDRLAGRDARIAQIVKRDHALRLLEAMGVDPVDLGL